MWDKIKRWFGEQNNSNFPPKVGAECEFKWYDPGAGNPFGIRFLDVRDFTWNVAATTDDRQIAETFNAQRKSDGQDLITANIEEAQSVECSMMFPHNGDVLEGIVYKADSMDVKWDIYIYDSVFLFARSWTGQLQYRAFAEIGDIYIRINKIETSHDHIETAPQAIYFILTTHAMQRVLPHTIPRSTPNDAQQIALLSFNMYGKIACYATYEDIIQIAIEWPDNQT